jgi:hypothetical protein
VGPVTGLTAGRWQRLCAQLSWGAMSTLKNAAYVAIGFGVIGFNRVQVRRRELTKQVKQVQSHVDDLVKTARRARFRSVDSSAG